MSSYHIYTFIPTYLYIKKHKLTGKLYFGKTIRNPEKYLGSGRHWLNHIKKHGIEHVETLWYCLFFDRDSISEFALNFSEQHNIVESDEWLNMMPENGLDNCTLKGIPKSKEQRLKMSKSHHDRLGTKPKMKIKRSFNVYNSHGMIVESNISMKEFLTKHKVPSTTFYRHLKLYGTYNGFRFEKIEPSFVYLPPGSILSRNDFKDSSPITL